MTFSQEQMREIEALVQRQVDAKMAQQRDIPTPSENFGMWSLRVTDSDEDDSDPDDPYTMKGINEIITPPGGARFVPGTRGGQAAELLFGSGGGHGYTWWVSQWEMFEGPLEMAHPMMASGTLTKLKWRYTPGTSGELTVAFYKNGILAHTQAMAGDGNVTLDPTISVAAGDTLWPHITDIVTYASIAWTIA